MKKLIALGFGLLLSTSAMSSHGPAGCGLGSILFEGKEGVVFNVLAVTFNGTSGNQTFAMSTGTLGCEDAKSAAVSAVSFIENNIIALSNDIAKGQGQTLNAYLTLVNKSNSNKRALRKNFSKIFSKNASAQSIHTRIMNLI